MLKSLPYAHPAIYFKLSQLLIVPNIMQMLGKWLFYYVVYRMARKKSIPVQYSLNFFPNIFDPRLVESEYRAHRNGGQTVQIFYPF
jgi:hypothetical protein